jgi:RNA 2',3'-cyclic 3'-phosphodiesterase
MRAFLAFSIPEEIKSYLQEVVTTMSRRTDGVKWVGKNGQHITLKFFDEIEESKAQAIREVLEGIEERYAPVSTNLGRVGAFPTERRARVIVVALQNGVDKIQRIFNDIENSLSTLDIEKETREFTPHITLGRRRVPAPLLERDVVTVEQKAVVLDSLVLYRSTLTKEGAQYDKVWEIKLRGEEM